MPKSSKMSLPFKMICFMHFILPGFVMLILCGENTNNEPLHYAVTSSSVTSSLLAPNILLTTLLPNVVNLFLNVTD
jgi:hypothetical protein